jgi:hypothetical protein
MKHLKLFESFDSGEYEEVDYNTWNSFGIISTLKESQINKIVESMKTKGFTDWHTTDKDGGYKRETIIFVSGLFTKIRTKIIISVMQDEWFKVCIMKSKKTQVTYDKEYYLCDQFDGLLKFIEEVL